MALRVVPEGSSGRGIVWIQTCFLLCLDFVELAVVDKLFWSRSILDSKQHATKNRPLACLSVLKRQCEGKSAPWLLGILDRMLNLTQNTED